MNLAVTHPTTIVDIVFALAILIVMMTMMMVAEKIWGQHNDNRFLCYRGIGQGHYGWCWRCLYHQPSRLMMSLLSKRNNNKNNPIITMFLLFFVYLLYCFLHFLRQLFFTCPLIDWQGIGDSRDKGRNYYFRSHFMSSVSDWCIRYFTLSIRLSYGNIII